MTYEEFEWHILRLVYEERLEKLQPAYLAYALGLPHESVTQYLDHAMASGLVELDVTEDGQIEYMIPGVDFDASLPKPVWKSESQPDGEPAADEHGADGSVTGNGASAARAGQPPTVPASLQKHIDSRYGTDGSARGGAMSVIATDAKIIDEDSAALVRYDDAFFEEGLPLRVESNDEAFCDPSRTMFMRQIRVYGEQSQGAIREQLVRLFQNFGYRVVDSGVDRMRLERGSVVFILALVPLFVLVLPLVIYLFLYCMGRSTIQQEPLELDVQFRHRTGPQPFWEIDLTFIGLHGVVLGAADQQVLNREIDTLRDELRWALAS